MKKKWINCNCNCVIGDYCGVMKTDGKVIICSNYGKGDCKTNNRNRLRNALYRMSYTL